MALEKNILTEVTQSQKYKYDMYALISGPSGNEYLTCIGFYRNPELSYIVL